MAVYEISSFKGGLSDYEDKGIPGAFKFGKNLDIRKETDSLSCKPLLQDVGVINQSISASKSPSASYSPSGSVSASRSLSVSPSTSLSPSMGSRSASTSPSHSRSPSASVSPSTSLSPSASVSLSPSPSAGLKTIFADLILWFVKASDGNVYGFGNTGYVYKGTPDGTWSQVYKARQRITGAVEFPADNGKVYLYFALRTELHRKELPGSSSWNDVNQISPGTADPGWPKTNLTDSDWHTMKECGGSLIAANYGTLALVGYDQSYTNEALNLTPGNISKTIVERDGRSIVGTFRAADPNRGVNGAIDSEFPLAQVGDDGDLFFANMVDSTPIRRFPGGGKVNPGGVANEVDQVNFFEWEQTALNFIDKQAVGNMALFGIFEADDGYNGIYSYGRKNKNHPPVMNLEHGLDVNEIGATTEMDGTLLVSYRDGVSFGVKATDFTTKATGIYQGLDFKAPVKKPIEITAWGQVELHFKPLPSNASIEFWYRINKSGEFVRAYTADNQASYNQTGGQKAVFMVGEEGEIFEPKVVLNPSGNNDPEVYRIRVFFD